MDSLELDKSKIPVHVGIIMDGNGRWAKKRNLLRTNGHNEGLKRAKEIASKEAELSDGEEESSGSVFAVTFVIVLIWVVILCLIVKLILIE